MSFDKATRNALAKLVAECRRLLTADIRDQLQRTYGLQPDGTALPIANLQHLDEPGIEIARELRVWQDHLASTEPGTEQKRHIAAFDRLAQETAFTSLNRLAALRLSEERGHILECVRRGKESDGFALYEQLSGGALGSRGETYRQFLQRVFDELAQDLGVLFDRRQPQSLVFPGELCLEEVLALLNDQALRHLWQEDETIGWIYQCYNSQEERRRMREESAAPRNSHELAVRNQFFTPRYVVEFLTDNTLGRIWYEMTMGATSLKDKCRYLVRRPSEIILGPGEDPPANAQQEETPSKSQEELLGEPVYIPHRSLKDPREIRLLDPACGSMHFGLYAFDLFEVMYEEVWDNYPDLLADLRKNITDKREFLKLVPKLIIEHNLHGIDIDPRCTQIAGLSLWLRAQKAWQRLGLKLAERPRIARSNIVCAEPMPGEKELLREFTPRLESPAIGQLVELVFDKMQLAGEAGSLLKIEEEIKSVVAQAKALWKQGPKYEQVKLFGDIPGKPEQQEFKLDLSGVTDEQFWEKAEERIYTALRDYADLAQNGNGYQRQLFAEDAARGFAFIDLCRRRYDVVLMNPPFGEFSMQWKDEAKEAYPNSYNDILGAFIDSFLHRLHFHGRLGAITSRTCFFLTSFTDWRNKVILADAALSVVADLGQGVMDNAMVEAAAYVMERAQPVAVIPFVRAIAEREREPVLCVCVNSFNLGKLESRLLLACQDTFKKLPDSPFVYWTTDDDLNCFSRLQQFEPHAGLVRQGLSTSDNPRFVRAIWEISPEDTIFIYFPTNGDDFCRLDDPIVKAYFRRRYRGTPRWAFHVMAGTSQPWYSPITVMVNFGNNGAELANFRDAHGRQKGVLRNAVFYHRPGFSWTRRATRFYPYLIPGNCIPSASRYMAFPNKGQEYVALGVSASLIASAFMRFYGEKFEWPNFLVENLKMLPMPDLDGETNKTLRDHIVGEIERRRQAYQNHEPFHEFLLPARVRDFSGNGRSLVFDATNLLGNECERMVENAYGFDIDAAARVKRDVLEALAFQSSDFATGEATENDDDEDDADDIILDYSEKSHAGALVSYALGTALGRWDIRFATGEKQAPELPDPFAPLPVCPPGMLQNAQCLPATSADVPADYPLRISWPGILVDDANHPEDIARRMHQVLEVIWKDRAEAIEHEACEILGAHSLREYFSKPNGFFADHLKRYSKSRRQAPIYWPLSSASGSYTVWIYYHRLNDDFLYKVVNDYVTPKVYETEKRFAQIETDLQRATGREATNLREAFEENKSFLAELQGFKAELLRVAEMPYKPNLNDGVLITAAPLWKLFRLPKWRKDLKECWEQLEAGNYDWAHLACSVWPERVQEKCKKDRSLAIAHDLESLCEMRPRAESSGSRQKRKAKAAVPAES